MRVALIMVAVSDLKGSGGAERLFSALHTYFAADGGPIQVVMITAASSLRRLRSAGHLHDMAGVIALPLGPHPGRGKISIAWMTVRLLGATLGKGFDVVHICLPTPIYVPYVAALGWIPKPLRPRTALTIIDCTLAPSLASPPPLGTYERQVLDAHRMYFRWTRPDGIYSWYRAFVDAASMQSLIAGRTLIRAARYCFTDPARFAPMEPKENVVVFAGRLSEQKRPLMFVDAVATLLRQQPDLIAGWRFEMYGLGVLEPEVRRRIAEHRLEAILILSSTPDLAPVLARTRLFVSTQAVENFTSLAMLEAMAAGNAVIAEDVGQTAEFVKHGDNGWVVRPATAASFATAIADYLRQPQRHDDLARASRAIATEVHTIGHFAADLGEFWGRLAQPESP